MTTAKLIEPRLGWIELIADTASPLPLKHTQVTAQLIGPLVYIAVTQQFSNPFDTVVELKYLFPLPHEAALIDFELKAGDRLIRGDLQEIKEAQKIYAQAVEDGKLAGLLEQRRPNLFAVNIANIQPGENIEAVVRYQHRISYHGGEYEFVFPMGITPKYHSQSHPDESSGVDAPIAGADEAIGEIEINVSVDAGTATSDINSPSHAIKVNHLDDCRFNLHLAESYIPDHDFVLRYAVARQAVAVSGWRTSGEEGDYFLATLLPPAIEEIKETTNPREFIFVLDRSGSMTGEPIAQARNALRACLRTLNENDTFRILLFDDKIEWYKQEPCHVNQQEVDKADKFLDTIKGRGGTEIVGALNASLSLPAYPDRTRFVIFLTDGAVSAEERALNELRQQIGNARLFTFGIGPSVNRALLSALARVGRGMAEFLQLDEDIEAAILRFQDRVSFPVITDMLLSWENGKAWDIYPGRMPDLYVDQPLEICGRLLADKKSPVMLKVDGSLEGKKIQMTLSLPEAKTSELIIQRVWARNRLDDLIEQQTIDRSKAAALQPEIISFALKYGLVSPYTAFVAVDTQPSKKKVKPVVINISQPLPEGLDIQGFLGAPMQPVFRMASPNILRSANFQFDMRDMPSAGFKSIPPMDVGLIKEQKVDSQSKQRPRDILKQLARTQKMNGSWDNDIETTITALLCFIRRGHTTNLGSYRKQVGRALKWLLNAKTSGFASFALAKLLMELSSQTKLSEHQQASSQALAGLPKPATPLEEAAHQLLEGKKVQPPKSIKSMDDLRLAALLNIKCQVPDSLKKGAKSVLAEYWSGAIQKESIM